MLLHGVQVNVHPDPQKPNMIGSRVAVVVDADVDELRKSEHTLVDAGFVVMAIASFAEAKALLHSISPEIVVADVKLAAFNGLHLAAICGIERPGTPFIITHGMHDVVLEADAKNLGAVYVVKTENRDELRITAARFFEGQNQEVAMIRRWPRKRLPIQTTAQVAAAAADVIDVSYGGIKLKVGQPADSSVEVPSSNFDITFPDLDLSLHAARIWAAPDARGEGWLCGVDVSQNDVAEIERWKSFVDSVN